MKAQDSTSSIKMAGATKPKTMAAMQKKLEKMQTEIDDLEKENKELKEKIDELEHDLENARSDEEPPVLPWTGLHVLEAIAAKLIKTWDERDRSRGKAIEVREVSEEEETVIKTNTRNPNHRERFNAGTYVFSICRGCLEDSKVENKELSSLLFLDSTAIRLHQRHCLSCKPKEDEPVGSWRLTAGVAEGVTFYFMRFPGFDFSKFMNYRKGRQ